MIHRSEIQSLNEDELSLLLYILNYIPIKKENEIDYTILPFVKKEAIIPKLNIALNLLREEYKPILHNLATKLSIQ